MSDTKEYILCDSMCIEVKQATLVYGARSQDTLGKGDSD